VEYNSTSPGRSGEGKRSTHTWCAFSAGAYSTRTAGLLGCSCASERPLLRCVRARWMGTGVLYDYRLMEHD